MKKYIYPSLVLIIFFTLILGIGYPLLVTQLGHTFWDFQAQGSLIKKNDIIVGSELIGQNWKKQIYFHGRPSASQYDPMTSGATNLSPINLRIKKHNADPQDMLLASASGLDPHISKEAAFFQISQVAKARKTDEKVIMELLISKIENKTFGVLGKERVNVLKLNMELDNLK